MENQRNRPHGPRRSILRTLLVYAAILGCICLIVYMMGPTPEAGKPQKLTYSQLLEWVENDLLLEQGDTDANPEKSVRGIIVQSDRLYGVKNDSKISDANFSVDLYDFEARLPSEEQFYTDVKNIYTVHIDEKVSPTNYFFSYKSEEPKTVSWFIQLLPSIIGFVLLIGFFIFMTRQQNPNGKGGMGNFVRGRIKLIDPAKNHTRYGDVAGAEEEKQELKEVVDFLKSPEKYTKVGAKIPKGVLLMGPPGTGKTLLARAVAGEAGVPFYTIAGSEFMEMYVGVGASRVRDLFDQAKHTAPSIIFIDEIDAIGRQRGAGLGGGHDEREQTLNQILVEMDGFTPNQGVIVMAATNRSDVLDPALLRPGRFDRQVVVNYPDVKGREEILKVHSKGKPLSPEVSLHEVAVMTPGCAGADLANIMNEAALLTARSGKSEIEPAAIEEAINRVSIGLEKKSHLIPKKDKEMTAYHEAGHAIVAYMIPECEKVKEITTIPRGMAGGYTKYMPDESSHYTTSAKLKGHIAFAMGGRCAEKLIYNDITNGASADIKQVTQIARTMVTEYGMSELGPIFLSGEHEVFLGRSFQQADSSISESLNSAIDAEVRKLITEGEQRAEKILTENRDKLEGLTKLLLEKERVSGEEFAAFMEAKPEEPEAAAETEETKE